MAVPFGRTTRSLASHTARIRDAAATLRHAPRRELSSD